MSAVTVKKPYGCGDKGPPEPLSPAAQWDESLTAAASLSCQDAVETMFFFLNCNVFLFFFPCTQETYTTKEKTLNINKTVSTVMAAGIHILQNQVHTVSHVCRYVIQHPLFPLWNRNIFLQSKLVGHFFHTVYFSYNP